VIAFNTVRGNGAVTPSGGLFLENATAEVRDNIFAANQTRGVKLDTAGTRLHHNDLFGSAVAIEANVGAEPLAWSNLGDDPLFTGPTEPTLQQIAAGQGADSPLVDRGSGSTVARDISGSTRTDDAEDEGTADIGFHRGAAPSMGVPPVQDPPGGGGALTLYVDATSGNDTRTRFDAGDPATPWQTLGRALQVADGAQAGDTISVQVGSYPGPFTVNTAGITVRAAGAVTIPLDAGETGFTINEKDGVAIEGFTVTGGNRAVHATDLADLVVRGCTMTGQAQNALSIARVDGATIDGNAISGATERGMRIQATSNVYVRNNLVVGNGTWGIQFTNEVSDPLSTGNVIAFNTVVGNGAGPSAGGGLQLQKTTGEVRDNVVTEQADVGLYLAAVDVTVHHNAFSGNGRDRDQKDDFLPSLFFWANRGVNPRYVDPAGADGVLGGAGWLDDDFRLQQLAAGDVLQSPVVDAGSGAVEALDISGSTARNDQPDAGIADLGFHENATAGVAAPAPMPVGDNLQRTFYVSASLGDDARTSATARRRETPWRTLARALNRVLPGDTVVVLPGTYAETIQIDVEDVTFLVEEPGSVLLAPPSGNGITIEAPDATVDGFVVTSASTGISVLETGPRATIRNCASIGSATDGIRASRVDGVTIESSIVASAGASGIRLKRVTAASVRNNLVYGSGDWGISLDAPSNGSVSAGNVIGHNTLHANRLGNLSLLNAVADVHDNLLTGTPGRALRLDRAGTTLRHNGFNGNGRAIDPPGYILSCTGCSANYPLAPHYVLPAGPDGVLGGAGWADDDFRLRSPADGGPVSQAIDAGSDAVASLQIGGTTSTTGALDAGIADLGFHYIDSTRAMPLPATALP